MITLSVIFLGIVALSSLVEAAFLLAIAIKARELQQRVLEMEERFERETRPSLQHLARISQNIAGISDLVAVRARRFDAVLAATTDELEGATISVRKIVLRPLVEIAAVVKSFRKGLEVYHRLGEIARTGTGRR
jgi:hypothetical protein